MILNNCMWVKNDQINVRLWASGAGNSEYKGAICKSKTEIVTQ